MKSGFLSIFRRKKKEKKKSAHGEILLGIGLLALVGSAALLFSETILRVDADDIFPKKTDFLWQVSLEKCNLPSELCAKRDQFLVDLTGFSPDRVKGFAGQMVFGSLKKDFDIEKKQSSLIAFQVSDQKAAETFLKNLAEVRGGAREERTGKVQKWIFSAPRSEVAFFFGGWLLFSEDLDFAENIFAKDFASLSDDSLFDSLGDSEIFVRSDFLRELLPRRLTLIFDFFEGAGITLSSSQNGLSADISLIAKGKNQDMKSRPVEIPKDIMQTAAVVFSGENLEEKWKTAFSVLEKSDSAFALSLFSEVRSSVLETLGGNINFEDDIIPLFSGNCTIALDDKNYFFVQITHPSVDFLDAKFEKFVVAAEKLAARASPRIETHQLSDGTEIREIVACQDCEEKVQTEAGFRFQFPDSEGVARFFLIEQHENRLEFGNSEILAQIFAQNDSEAKEFSEWFSLKKSFAQGFFPNLPEIGDFERISAGISRNPHSWNIVVNLEKDSLQ